VRSGTFCGLIVKLVTLKGIELSPRILLVEDEVCMLLEVEHALESAGFEVVPVNNAADAIACYDANPTRFSGLVTNIRLGVGQTGWDIAWHFRRISPLLPVVYISGHGSSQWRSQGVPGSVLIEKPFAMATVITNLAYVLSKSSPGSSHNPV
jgi:two-component system OmpR family response regulator